MRPGNLSARLVTAWPEDWNATVAMGTRTCQFKLLDLGEGVKVTMRAAVTMKRSWMV